MTRESGDAIVMQTDLPKKEVLFIHAQRYNRFFFLFQMSERWCFHVRVGTSAIVDFHFKNLNTQIQCCKTIISEKWMFDFFSPNRIQRIEHESFWIDELIWFQIKMNMNSVFTSIFILVCLSKSSEFKPTQMVRVR